MVLKPDADQMIHAAARSIIDVQQVIICGWCPDARERMLALKRQGREVSHGMCQACAKKFEGR